MRILEKRCSGGCRNWTCWTERITTHSHCLQTPCRYTTTAHTLTSNRNTLSLSSDSLQVYNYSSHTDFKPQHTLTVFRLPAGIQLQLTHWLQTATHSHCLQTPCRYTTTAHTLTSNRNTLSLSSDSLQVYNYSSHTDFKPQHTLTVFRLPAGIQLQLTHWLQTATHSHCLQTPCRYTTTAHTLTSNHNTLSLSSDSLQVYNYSSHTDFKPQHILTVFRLPAGIQLQLTHWLQTATHSHCLQTPCRYTTTAHTLTSNRNTLSLSSDSLQVYNYSSHTHFKPQHTLTVFRLPAGIQLQLTHWLQTATHSHCLQTPCRYTTTAHTLTSNRNTLSLSSDSLQVYNYSSHTDFKPQHTLTVFRLPAGIQLQLTHWLQTATHSHCLQTPCRYTTTAHTLTSNRNTLSLSSDSLQV